MKTIRIIMVCGLWEPYTEKDLPNWLAAGLGSEGLWSFSYVEASAKSAGFKIKKMEA